MEISGPCSGGAGEDGVLEGLWFDSATEACQVWVLVEPGWVGVQVTYRRSHLVDSSRHELSQAHERVWGEGGGLFIVRRGVGGGGPVLEEHVPSTATKGLVGSLHERWGRGMIVPGGGVLVTREGGVRGPLVVVG